mmetsp:Transcript_24281/g.37422  ORF Transcript_24281/g.37422 Transcript_24281/m.37422 type:complete len:82 (-) Transcript_24281:10-255(-)
MTVFSMSFSIQEVPVSRDMLPCCGRGKCSKLLEKMSVDFQRSLISCFVCVVVVVSYFCYASVAMCNNNMRPKHHKLDDILS